MTRCAFLPGFSQLFLLAGLLAACRPMGLPTASAAIGDLEIRRGFAYEPITAASGAAYVEILNHGTIPDTLLSAASPIAAMTMFHGSSMADMSTLAIPAGGRVSFKPGGAHIMLATLSKLPKAGDSIRLTLTFARAGPVTLELPVRAYGAE